MQIDDSLMNFDSEVVAQLDVEVHSLARSVFEAVLAAKQGSLTEVPPALVAAEARRLTAMGDGAAAVALLDNTKLLHQVDQLDQSDAAPPNELLSRVAIEIAQTAADASTAAASALAGKPLTGLSSLWAHNLAARRSCSLQGGGSAAASQICHSLGAPDVETASEMLLEMSAKLKGASERDTGGVWMMLVLLQITQGQHERAMEMYRSATVALAQFGNRV